MTDARLGLESGTVRVVPYCAEWPAMFEAEVARIRAGWPAALPLWIEHTGSTAIPGLAAKPVLDILGGHPVTADVTAYIAALRALGYDYRGEQGIPGRHFFRRGEPRSYHFHLAAHGGGFWRDHLAFRDALRADPALARAYEELKLRLAREFPTDRASYIEGKTEFVLAVLRTLSL